MNESVLEKCEKTKKTLQRIELYIGTICLFVMLLVMLANIIGRYLFYKPIFWSDELNNYLFIWLGFLASAYVMGDDNHIRVDSLVCHLPQSVRCIVKIVMDCIMLVMFLCYVFPSVRMLGKLKKSNMMRIPLKYVYVIMPICFLLMAIHITINIIQELNTVKRLLNSKEE